MKLNSIKYYTPDLKQSWLLVAILLLGGLFFGAIIRLLYGISHFKFLEWQSVSYLLMMVPPFLWILYSANRNERCAAHSVKVDNPDFGCFKPAIFFVLIFICVVLLSIISDPLTSFIPMPESFKAMFRQVFVDNNIIDLVISVSILAPLCEEMLCRGTILRGLLQHTTPAKAIIWSAVIFAVIHANPWQAIPAFILGAFFGWIYYRTKSIWAVIFLHSANNTMSVILTKLFPELDVDQGLADMVPMNGYIMLVVAALVLLSLIIYYLNKKLPYVNQIQKTISA
ncbi:MAG: type II CAAX endopeptidase family protein [Bacteroidales bacterium]|nr:type II CAAX endopeptidase family protein [Bacteroidales bacterium]MDD4670520.1 type II CAAX endopeptidase family protein [Bacteroidales bacterium]